MSELQTSVYLCRPTVQLLQGLSPTNAENSASQSQEKKQTHIHPQPLGFPLALRSLPLERGFNFTTSISPNC